MSIVSARALHKAYGANPLFEGISLTIEPGDRVGLLGRNGTGKSTLLRVIAGLEPYDGGTVDRTREGGEIAYLAQEPVLDPLKTPREIVLGGMAAWGRAKERYDAISHALESGEVDHGDAKAVAAMTDEQAHLAEAIERLGGWERGHEAEQMLAKLAVREPDRLVGNMSGGEKRRVALAALLVSRPALAILDEPTNHLDADTIEWLEGFLADDFGGAVLLVTHDRYVLDAVATRIVELEQGGLVDYAGNYGDYLEQKAERLAHASRAESNRLNLVRRERAWLMRGAKARSTKQKARIQRAEAVIADVPLAEQGTVNLAGDTMQAGRLGNTVVELHDASLVLGERRLIDSLTLHVRKGERIGILGPNGAGKTSLLKLISGEFTPTAGKVVRGNQTKLAYFDQSRALLDDDRTIFENVAEISEAARGGGRAEGQGGEVVLRDRTVDVRTYLEMFLFDPSRQRQKVGSLSGGERARVALAITMKQGANVLLLDEPTNDLDVATLAALEEMMNTWAGAALVVSHDRYFLNRVATSVLAFEADGKVVRYPGNYDTYRSLKAAAEEARLAEESEKARVSRAKTTSEPPRDEKAKPSAAKPSAKASEPKPDPLTHAERLELESLLERVDAAEQAVAAAQKAVEDPTVQSKPADLKGAQWKLKVAEKALATVTARWEALEAKR